MAKPAKCISVADAKAIQKNWNDSRGADIESALGGPDTFEFTYNIDELREYLDYVEDQATKQGIANPGVRLYFAAYNDSKSQRATVFMCPSETDDKDSANIYTIDAFNQNGGGWPPKKYE